MNEPKRTWKQRFSHGIKQGLAIASYLFVVFTLFDIHKSVILAEYQFDLVEFGLNFINASALAKVILLGQELDFAEWFRDAPLIYSTLLKSFAYTVLLALFKIIEEFILATYHGRSIGEGMTAFSGEPWKVLLSLSVALFVVLIPFFGFGELRRVFGEDIVTVFFRPRHFLNLPAADSAHAPKKRTKTSVI